jgi:undecaprenyl-diphosphatase
MSVRFVIFLFLVLGVVASMGAAHEAPAWHALDISVFRFLNDSIKNPFFDDLMPVVTDLSRWRIVLLLVWAGLVIVGGSKGRWAALLLIPIIAASDQLSSHALKPLVERMRPCEMLGGIHLWYGPEGWIVTPDEVVGGYKTSFAFPSSHAANITSSMLFLALVYRRWMALPLTIMVLVSFSRIYVGVHWPSDVIAGIALGAILATIAYGIFRRLYKEENTDTAPRRRNGPAGPSRRPEQDRQPSV